MGVVEGSYNDYRGRHPARAVLVVEVADTAVEFDRDRKGPLYAAAHIPEYWLVYLPHAPSKSTAIRPTR